MNHPKLQIILRILMVLILTVIGVFLLYQFLRLTYPFLIAMLFAFLINPVVQLLEKYIRFPRPLAVLTSLLLLFVIVGGIATYGIIKIIQGFRYLSEMVPNQIEQISSAIQKYFNEYILPLWNQGEGFMNNLESSQQQALQEGIQLIGTNLASVLGNLGQAIANGLSSFVGALPITFTVIIFTILAIYFISKDWNKYKASLKKKLPSIIQEQTYDVLKDLKMKVFGFLKSQIILMSLTAFVCLIGLFVLRVDYVLTLAVILGLLELLPYVGPGLVLIPWAVYVIFTGDIFLGIGLFILYACTVTVRQISEPKVLSSTLKLNPLAILISFFVGLQWFGLLGLAIGPILLVILISLYEARIFDGIWEYIKG
ncbi:sporulation integral membrane protein YtvI [Oceanobacillus piezotolerans]|uniref:Sporulation integral membrane protein YtvI n=1 Tax=Oceanobacillus piezotolerans TaxID=2448030 RepID=A0A498D527_9BACI|nr:sporulation integral membrane protein YtvI [Oceanobacillus piezotolerans]RLL43713.1 sporulation integral membrane protein YtvI [Oceanobacillus piezotolerans]